MAVGSSYLALPLSEHWKVKQRVPEGSCQSVNSFLHGLILPFLLRLSHCELGTKQRQLEKHRSAVDEKSKDPGSKPSPLHWMASVFLANYLTSPARPPDTIMKAVDQLWG